MAIEAWVRDAATLGKLARGEPLPGRKWFREKFQASSDTVTDAFSALAEQGFVAARPRGITVLRTELPFDGRYLLVLASDIDGPAAEGLDLSLRAAAAETEARRDGSWKIVPGLPRGGELDALLAEIAEQRFAGVFSGPVRARFRTARGS